MIQIYCLLVESLQTAHSPQNTKNGALGLSHYIKKKNKLLINQSIFSKKIILNNRPRFTAKLSVRHRVPICSIFIHVQASPIISYYQKAYVGIIITQSLYLTLRFTLGIGK